MQSDIEIKYSDVLFTIVNVYGSEIHVVRFVYIVASFPILHQTKCDIVARVRNSCQQHHGGRAIKCQVSPFPSFFLTLAQDTTYTNIHNILVAIWRTATLCASPASLHTAIDPCKTRLSRYEGVELDHHPPSPSSRTRPTDNDSKRDLAMKDWNHHITSTSLTLKGSARYWAFVYHQLFTIQFVKRAQPLKGTLVDQIYLKKNRLLGTSYSKMFLRNVRLCILWAYNYVHCNQISGWIVGLIMCLVSHVYVWGGVIKINKTEI
jgi:hypothetical protein